MTSPAAIPPRVLAVVVPVIAAGTVTVGFALYRYATVPRSAGDVAALLGLFAAMALAERFPVPVEVDPTGRVYMDSHVRIVKRG